MKFEFSPAQILGLTALAALSTYAAFFHPAILRLGTTPEELDTTWPGDELARDGNAHSTHAITINASAAAVWPWLLQLGQDRAGFYSHTWLENLFGMEMPDYRKIVPEFQHREIGEALWLAPAKRFGGNARFILTEIEPERALIFVQPADADVASLKKPIAGLSWALILQAQSPQQTRLISRSVDNTQPGPFRRVLRALILDSGHCIMVWKMLQTIKRYAESAPGGDHSKLPRELA